jgi:hypothetical protein
MNKETIEILNLLNDIKRTLEANRNKKRMYDIINTYYTMSRSDSYDSNIANEIYTCGTTLLYEYNNRINGYEL